MRKTISLLSAVALLGVLASGCANMDRNFAQGCEKIERKFGRGMANTFEIVRAGEYRRSMEQVSLMDSPNQGYTFGSMRGVNRTFARTGIGIYEIVTAPFPPYHPVWTNEFAPNPVYPDNYSPDLVEDSMFATDTYVGYSGGDVLPVVPGSRFQIFETH